MAYAVMIHIRRSHEQTWQKIEIRQICRKQSKKYQLSVLQTQGSVPERVDSVSGK